MSCRIVSGDPTTTQHSAAVHAPGSRFTYNHPDYGPWELEYTKLEDAVTYVAGHVLSYADATRTAMTNDISASASEARCAGVGLMVYTQNYYGYVLKKGYYPAVVTNGDDDIAIGDTLIIHESTDGACDSVSGATNTGDLRFVGVALAADVDAANTVAAAVSVPM